MMQHKKSVLFLVSLSKRTIQEIENKGVGYQFFMRTIRVYSHVEFHDTISEQLISTASLYRVVVIIGHQVDRCIELSDGSLFPMEKIVSALPASFNGYLHVAVCGSSIVKLAIKDRCPYSKVRTSPETTQLELQFLIYSQLLSHTDLSKENFSDRYNCIRRNIMEEQGRKKPVDLAKLPCATKLGENPSEDVKTTVYSPRHVVRGEYFSIFIAMHFDADNGTLFFDQRNNDPMFKEEDKIPRVHNFVLNNVHYGDELSIKIRFEDASEKPTELIWVKNNNPQSVKISDKIVPLEFRVFVDAEYPCKYFTAILEYIKDGHCLKKFDYHRYGFESVHSQYYTNTKRSQINTAGDKTWLSQQPGLINSKKGKGRTSRVGEKVTKAFKYKESNSEIANKRLACFYDVLLNKYKWIHKDTDKKTFIDLFRGGECTYRIVWIDDVNTLAELFRRLVRVEKFVEVQSPYGLWQMVDGHFWDKEGNKPFGNDRLRKTHTPRKNNTHIDCLMSVLDYRLSEEQVEEILRSALPTEVE